jgi:hypothetical protein
VRQLLPTTDNLTQTRSRLIKRVFRIKGKGKMKDIGLRGLAVHPEIEDVNTTVALIQALIPLGK